MPQVILFFVEKENLNNKKLLKFEETQSPRMTKQIQILLRCLECISWDLKLPWI